MKRGLIIVLFGIFVLATFSYAAPTVAIVRGSSETLKDSWRHEQWLNWVPKVVEAPIWDPKSEERYWAPEWTPESEREIFLMVNFAIARAGNWPHMSGKTVLIKVNANMDLYNQMRTGKYSSNHLLCMTTDARVARAVALKCKDSGATRIYIAEAPACADAISSLMAFGHKKYIPELGKVWSWFGGSVWRGRLVSLNEPPYEWKYFNGDRYCIPEAVLHADLVISVSPMKTHCVAGVSATLKNIGIGCLPARVYGAPKVGLSHPTLYQTIARVCSIVRPAYGVISAIYGGEGFGPSDCDPVYLGVVIAGSDLVAVDATALEVMKLNPFNYGTLREAQALGLGQYEGFDKVCLQGRWALGPFFVQVPEDVFFATFLHRFQDVPATYLAPGTTMYRAPREWGGVTHW